MISIKEANVTIMVKDMDMAVSFYERIGLTLKQRWDNHYAMMMASGITIGLHPSEDAGTNSGTVSIGFMIENIEEAKTLLDTNKTAYTSQDGKSGIYVHFKDPFGTILYFVKPKW